MSVLDDEQPDLTNDDGGSVALEAAPSTSTRSKPIAPEAPSPPKRRFNLATGDQLAIGSLAILVLVLMGWHWARMSGWGSRPIEVERMPAQTLDYQIDINSATYIELLQLDAIGEKLAQRIITDRETNGPFKSVDELQRVKGIGPKTVERLRKFLRVSQSEVPREAE